MLGKQIPFYHERHTLRPGLTGWAQIRYQYGSSVGDAKTKLEYELFYIKHLSLFRDLTIIFRTIQVVLSGKGSR
jgi:lipopolysaccharide/colanic/teichoic acid biosynthesis glycosyltransferase